MFRSGLLVCTRNAVATFLIAHLVFSTGTYIAFCRKYGEHSTTAVDWHSWNAEAMTSMVDDLKYPWNEVRWTLGVEHNEKLTQIENLIGECNGKRTQPYNYAVADSGFPTQPR